jgi:hypothetical protein
MRSLTVAKLVSWNCDSFGQAANPAALFDSVSEVGGSLTLATLAGMPGKHLAFSGDGETAAACYGDITLPAATSTLVMRLLVEFSSDFLLPATPSMYLAQIRGSHATLPIASVYCKTWPTLSLYQYADAGSTSNSTVGSVAVGMFNEIWLLVNVATGTDGVAGLVGSTGAPGVVRRGENDGRGQALSVRIGPSAGVAFGGTMWVHEIDLWDAKPDELEDVHHAAGAADYRSGLPAVLDVEAPTGGTVTAIDVRRAGGDWQSVSLTGATSTRPDAATYEASITTADLDAATGTFDGCLVSGTAVPGIYLPDVQVVKHLQGDGVGTILMSSCPWWIGLQTTDYAIEAQPAQTFAVWRVKEVSAGVYRVGLPGSVIGCGRHELRMTFADESTTTAIFDAYAIGIGEVGQYPPGGKHISVSYDDGRVNQTTQFRYIYSGRPGVRPCFNVVAGRGNSYELAPWAAWRLMRRCGCHITNHMWNNDRMNSYASDELSMAYLTAARDVLVLQGFYTPIVVWSGGVGTLPSGANAVIAASHMFALARGSSGTYRNAVPIDRTATTNAGSIYGNSVDGTYEGTLSEQIAAWLAAMAAEGDAPGWWQFQFHDAADTAGNSSNEFIAGCIDAAIAAGYRFERLDRMLAASEE